jgi:uncharacterized protein YjaG (DUF416 family)
MGCGNSSVSSMDFKDPKFKKEYILYHTRNDELELLGQDVLDDCIKKGNGTPDGINQIYNEIYTIKKGTGNLNEVEMKKAIKELFVQQALMSENIIEEYDIQNKISELLSNYSKYLIETYTKESIDNIFQSLFVTYPSKQIGYYIKSNPKNFLEQGLDEAFYTNLKYNKTFKVQCMALNIDNTQINDNYLLDKYSEIIACNDELKTFILILNDNIPLGTNLKGLNNIFHSLKDHHSLCAFIFLSKASENKLTLTPEIENNILNLLDKITLNKKEILNVFIMGNFLTSNDYLKKLTDVIPNAGVLKVFAYIINDNDPQISDVNSIDNLVFKGIRKNNMLTAVFLGGFKISDNKIKEFRQLEKDKSNNIKILQCSNQLNIDI